MPGHDPRLATKPPKLCGKVRFLLPVQFNSQSRRMLGRRAGMKLPVDYNILSRPEIKLVRELYVENQGGKCFFCKSDLKDPAPSNILNKKINWKLFPENFLKYPVHLQHDHNSGMTEGAVHAYCNAVMWQYHGR